MGAKIAQRAESAWRLAHRQHGVIGRRQLLQLGFTTKAIRHRVTSGRLHPVFTGVFAVGRPELSAHGRWMAAVLGCRGGVVSHGSAAALWEIRAEQLGPVHVSSPAGASHRRRGVVIHRRRLDPVDIARHCRIPVTSPACTLVDIALALGRDQLEAAVNEADKRGLVDPEQLRAALDTTGRRPGIGRLRQVLDRRTFVLTDSALERRFLPIARRCGLPPPEAGLRLNGYEVDFYWPDLRLVVETDGLRYHRTPAQQACDRRRDQAHTAAGLVPLRFTHAQIAFDRQDVERTLAAVVRLSVSDRGGSPAHWALRP